MRRAHEIELALGPRADKQTLQQWLYAQVREAILSGRVQAGQRLPTTRELARQQAVSRGTVLAVYEQLTAEGYLSGQVGSGTIVSHALPALGQPAPPSGAAGAAGAVPGTLSARGRLLAHTPFSTAATSPVQRAFRPHQPDVASFPLELWNRIATRRANAARPALLAYGDAAGYWPLRQTIAEHLRYAQRIACDPAQVMIVGSAQQALDLCARLLLDPDDAVWLEDPGYPGAAAIFRMAGARIAPVPVDRCGLVVEKGLEMAPAARLAYVSAAHQMPLGMSLSVERRLALLDWARTRNATILEDDYDGEFRYRGTPLAALKSLDRDGRVIYMGTFSKVLFPALRLAYVVLPDWLTDAFAAALSLTCRHVPLQAQLTLREFIADGHFARHLRSMRLLYGERAEALQQACSRHLDGWLSVLPITTGIDASALLPAHADDRAVAARLAAAQIDTRPLSRYAIGTGVPAGLVLGFSSYGVEQIEAGVQAIARVVEGDRALARGIGAQVGTS